MELYLTVDYKDKTFTVERWISNPLFDYSVFIVSDYPYTPWIPKKGNLLW